MPRNDDMAAQVAIQSGDADTLQELISGGLDPNFKAAVQAFAAANGGRVHGQAMNVRTPLLFLASQAQQYKCAMVLLNAKADPNATFNSPMSGFAEPPLVACRA